MTPADLKAVLRYDPETGVFIWAKAPKHHPDLLGKPAGAPVPSRGKFYHVIQIGRVKYRRGRLAFLYMEGRWPEEVIDHANGDSLDDRWANLREATSQQNNWNRKRGAKKSPLPMGVRQAQSGRYVARISQNKSLITIGTFDTPEAAEAAYNQERMRRYGQFA